MKDVYDRIDDMLKKKGKNRKEMCLDINLSYNTLASFYRRRSNKIKLDTLRKIADYLGTTIDYLIYGNEELKKKPAKELTGLKLEWALNEVGLEMSDLDNLSDEQSKLIAATLKNFLKDKSKF